MKMLYVCEVCNKIFTWQSHLNIQLRFHTKEKPFICEVCNKGFSRKFDLNAHFRFHTGEKCAIKLLVGNLT